MQREMYFDDLEAVHPTHDTQEHVNHEHTEALQPRLSLGPSPSSPIPPTIMENTSPNNINATQLPDTNLHVTSSLQSPCSKTANGFPETTTSDTPDATTCFNTNSGFLNTSNGDTPKCLNSTTSGFLISTNSDSPTGSTCMNTVSGFVSPNINCVDGLNGVLNIPGGNITTTGVLDTDLVNTSGFNTSGFHETSGDSSSPLDSVGGLKRKRDWMNSLTQPQFSEPRAGQFNYKGNTSSSLQTSVRINNGSFSFPAGWEQYLDLQTGETYYVNWNTRTKHCKVQCPEVQRCLAGAHATQESTHNISGSMKQKLSYSNNSCIPNNKDTVEEWLSKMTATTSVLVNNQSLHSSKPPLPPTHSLKPGKQTMLGGNTTSLPNFKPFSFIKTPSTFDTPHLLSDNTNVPTIAQLTSINNNILLNNTTTNMPLITHAMHNPTFLTSQTCDYTSAKYW